MTVDPKIQNQQDVGFPSDSMSEILIELTLNLSRYIQSFIHSLSTERQIYSIIHES